MRTNSRSWDGQQQERCCHAATLVCSDDGARPTREQRTLLRGQRHVASNTSADEAEAGMFQTSWNIRAGDDYASSRCWRIFGRTPMGSCPSSKMGWNLKADDLGNYGTGDGAKYQFLVEVRSGVSCVVTALGLRGSGNIGGRSTECGRAARGCRRAADGGAARREQDGGSYEPSDCGRDRTDCTFCRRSDEGKPAIIALVCMNILLVVFLFYSNNAVLAQRQDALTALWNGRRALIR